VGSPRHRIQGRTLKPHVETRRAAEPCQSPYRPKDHVCRSNSLKICRLRLRFTFEPPRMLCTDDSRSDSALRSSARYFGYLAMTSGGRTIGLLTWGENGAKRGKAKQATLWVGQADGLDPGAVVPAMEPSRGAGQIKAGPASGCVRRCCNASHDGSNLPPRRFDERASHRPLGPGSEKPGCAYEAKGSVNGDGALRWATHDPELRRVTGPNQSRCPRCPRCPSSLASCRTILTH
jgi:hypothetical protein